MFIFELQMDHKEAKIWPKIAKILIDFRSIFEAEFVV